MTFATKILIVVLNKFHVTQVINNDEFWMKKKVNEIHFHPLIGHIQLKCDFLSE